MKIIGVTGGIGSGKSTVSKFISHQGYPVYNSDLQAKQLMNESNEIKVALTHWFGESIYVNNQLNRKKLAEIIFNNTEALQKVNQLVHPLVFNDFERWAHKQISPLVFKESAILFESGAYKTCDYIITISAPENIRISRASKRDISTTEEIKKRIKNQWNDEMREKKAHFVIHNSGTLKDLQSSVEKIISELIKLTK